MKKAKPNLKYVPMCNSDAIKGENLRLGRHECLCEGTEHKLINNCLHCGRIVCEQEGSGPCFTCHHLVCTVREQDVISQENKAGYKLYQRLMGDEPISLNDVIKIEPNLQTALKHRDKLLEFDKTVERRTKVIDDENDYFQADSNQWLSAKEKKILKQKEQEFHDALHSRKNTKLTFDFAGRQVIEEKSTFQIDIDELLNSDLSIFECEDTAKADIDYNPVYAESKELERFSNGPLDEKVALIRIQDRELQEMSDEGMCISLHQPYASLLVSGIKKHEGRAWYTSYRGRLWIHSAGKKVTQQDIMSLENTYCKIVDKCVFPKDYPTACLLGCVDLVDCLPQEAYSEKFPSGICASPYVFICEHPVELRYKFPMKGKHKIFKLDENIHSAAKTTLRKQI